MSWFIRWHGYPDWSVHWAQQTKQHQNGGGAGTQGGNQNPRMISTVRKTYRDQYIWTSSCLQTGLSATFFLGRLIRRPAFGSWTWLPHNSNLFGPGINRKGTKKPVCAMDIWSLAQSGSLPWYGRPSGGQHRIGRGWDPDMAYPWWTVGQMESQEKSKVQRQKRQRNSEKNTHQRAVVPTWFQHGSNMVPTWPWLNFEVPGLFSRLALLFSPVPGPKTVVPTKNCAFFLPGLAFFPRGRAFFPPGRLVPTWFQHGSNMVPTKSPWVPVFGDPAPSKISACSPSWGFGKKDTPQAAPGRKSISQMTKIKKLRQYSKCLGCSGPEEPVPATSQRQSSGVRDWSAAATHHPSYCHGLWSGSFFGKRAGSTAL